jgi:4'-phosphopantetheinyl transferase
MMGARQLRGGLTASNADLWLLDEAAVGPLSERCAPERLLDADERTRYRRMRTAAGRRRQLGARLLCRHALSAYADLPPHRWRFRSGPFGRPEPEPNPWGLRFNLSHTDGLIACVVTSGQACGVDVERSPAAPETLRLAGRFLAPAERRHLATLAPAARAACFADFWVLKEAYTKALGEGLTRPFDSFAVDPRPARAIGVHDPAAGAVECARWAFELLHLGDRYALAVAVRRAHPELGAVALRQLNLPAVLAASSHACGSPLQ